MGKIYQLRRVEKLGSGIIRHEVSQFNQEEIFTYLSIRIGCVWPSLENPAYFCVGGMEPEDKLSPSVHGIIRIIEECEVQSLSLDTLFDSLSDSYISMICDAIYVDCAEAKQDYRNRLWDYLDKRNLRGVNVFDVPFRDTTLRFSTVKDFDKSGNLIIDKGSLLFQDLQSISRAHLGENPEERFYRLNALSYLLSGFEKFKPSLPMRIGKVFRGGRDAWMKL